MSAAPAAPLAIVADRLVDGTGAEPVTDAAVVVEGDRITAVGPRSTLRIPPDAHVLEGDDVTVLPGFIDCHVHLGGASGFHLARMLMTPPSLALLHAVPNCAATLRAGVTTVRDAGLAPAALRIAAELGHYPAPRMQMAVSILSQTGGHGDSCMPCGSRLPIGAQVDVPDGVVDGADAMRRKVREVLRAGADWIKLCTSGGVLSPGDLPDRPQFSVEEIAIAVAEAAAQGKRCMAHAMSAQGIVNAVGAGVVSIEHGCLLDEEGIDLMRRNGAWLVPTLVAPEDVIAGAECDPGSIAAEMVAKARTVRDRHRQAVAAAVEAGVRIAMGTDSAVGPHGGNLRELSRMVGCGMTPLQAIRAATHDAAELLGIAERFGTLRPGMGADIVIVAGDPVRDIHRFDDPSCVRAVIKEGSVVRNEL